METMGPTLDEPPREPVGFEILIPAWFKSR